MNWFYEKNGTQKGPVSGEELQALLSRQEISDKTMIWREGMGDWTPLHRIAEFAPKTTAPAVAYNNAPAATPETSTPSYGPAPTVFPQVAERAAEAKAFNSLALISLIAGVLSMLLCGWLIGAIGVSLTAIISGHIARGKSSGRGMALGGLITGYLGLVLGVVMFFTQSYLKSHPEVLESLQQEAMKQQKQR